MKTKLVKLGIIAFILLLSNATIFGQSPYKNTATITSDQSDPDSGNNLSTVTPKPKPVVTFTYVTPFCKDASNPLPIMSTYGVKGVFSSSPSGLVFVSTATGEINIAASTPGTYTITNTKTYLPTDDYTTNSASYSITINALPSISSNPSTSIQSVCLNSTSTALSVTAAAGSGTISTYEWFSNTTNSTTGVNVTSVATHNSASTTDSYTPLTTSTGTLYYFVVVTNSNGCAITSAVSGAITINALPNISVEPSTSTQSVCLNSTSTALSVTAAAGSGTISTYEWFSNTTNSTTGVNVTSVATHTSALTTDSYTPLTTSAGTLYYFVVVTNSNSCTKTSIVSGAVTVNALPSISAQPSTGAQTVCVSSTSTALSVTAAAGSGTISTYEWFKNTTNSTSGGTSVATHTSASTTDTYTPSTASVGDLYYYVVVTNSNGCTVTSAASGKISITPCSDLAISKTVDNATPTVGDNIVFTLTVTNNGPSNATGVKVTDLLSAAYEYISDDSSSSAYNSTTGLWTIGNLANGDSAILKITVKVKP